MGQTRAVALSVTKGGRGVAEGAVTTPPEQWPEYPPPERPLTFLAQPERLLTVSLMLTTLRVKLSGVHSLL